jgi:hypothetical protein
MFVASVRYCNFFCDNVLFENLNDVSDIREWGCGFGFLANCSRQPNHPPVDGRSYNTSRQGITSKIVRLFVI